MPEGFSIVLPPRTSLAHAVAHAVRELILEGHLAEGARIGIDDLAKQLDISTTPVREALAALESDGWVSRIAHRGYTVSLAPSLSSLDQLFEVRLLVEPHAAFLAAVAAGAADLKVIEEANEGIHSSMASLKTDPNGMCPLTNYQTFDRVFHESICRASGNPLLADTMIRLRAHSRIALLYFSGGVVEASIAEHDRVLDAIQRGDQEEARQAMVVHLEVARDRYRPFASLDH